MPPLETLPWERFEQLCESLLRAANPDANVYALTLGGGRGSDGVDFIVEHPTGDRNAYQAKRQRQLKPSVIRSWIRKFTGGEWAGKCRSFSVLSAVRPPQRVVQEFMTAAAEVKQSTGHDLSFEDPAWFNDHFVQFPHVVGEFFEDDWRERYERRAMHVAADVESRKRKADSRFHFHRNGNVVVCKGLGFRFECYLPTQRETTVGGTFVFDEPGAYAATISLGNDDVLNVLECEKWRDGVPFLVGSQGDTNYLQIANVRIGVPETTLEPLARGLRMLRDEWHAAIDAIDMPREAYGYQYARDHEGVVLGKIRADMWQMLIRFANAHQHDAGDGPFFIFMDQPSSVNVFGAAHGMRPRHHLMLQTDPPVAHAERSSGSWLTLVWRLPPTMFDDCRSFSREAWWPAHMAAVWLEEALLPATWHWLHPDRRTIWDKLRRRPHVVPPFEPSDYWRRKRAPRIADARPKDREELAALVEQIQSHYSLRFGCTFNGELLRAIDAALLRLIERADLTYWGYLRSKGDLKSDDREGMVQELRHRLAGHYPSIGSFGLEWRLRTFSEVCRASTGPVDESDAEAVARELLPLSEAADRHNQRLAHRSTPCHVYPK